LNSTSTVPQKISGKKKMANENSHFRIATLDDAMDVRQLIESAFRAEDSRQGWVGNSDLASRFSIEEKTISSIITNPDSTFLMASDANGKLLGTIGVSKRGPDSARLFMLAVDPQYHRGGIGKQILTYAEDYCQREWSPKVLGLDALSNRETLISWYMRRGYRKTGKSTPFPREEFKDLNLPDDLHFVEFEKILGPAHDENSAI
jgi:ribosomal protein S18 acetylase RimI-like enzyme